jgi:hypothetical protein
VSRRHEFPGTASPHAPYLGKASGHSHDPRPVGQRDEVSSFFEERGRLWTPAEREANRVEWNAMVERACADLDDGDKRPSDVEAAIWRELDRLKEAGEPVPRPASLKWALKLTERRRRDD